MRNRPHCQRCTNIGRFGATLLLSAFATVCDKMQWHGCAQQSTSDGRGPWQAGLQLEVAKSIVTAARRKELGCRSSPDKWLLREEIAQREEVPERRGRSVAQQRK